MIHMQNVKVAKMVAPISVNGATATATSVNTKGFDYATILFELGAIAADMTAAKIQYSSDDSTYTDITGASWTAPTTASDAGTQRIGFIDLRKLTTLSGTATSLYLKPVLTAGAGATVMACYCILSRAVNVPNDITSRGVSAQFIV